MVLDQVRLVRQMFGFNCVHDEFCSCSFIWCLVRLGYVSLPNVWMDSVHDDVADISDAQVTAQRINELSVTCC